MMAQYATGIETRDALIDAAGELAAEIGFDNVSTRAVAERAGENIGSIHYHFGTKEKLFEAVIAVVSRKWKQRSIAMVLKELEGELDRPEGQSRAIRAAVHHYLTLLFGHERPAWHCRVTYQVMQCAGPLQDLLLKEMVRPSHKAIIDLIRRIKPELSYREAFVHVGVMTMPLAFHADFMPAVLRFIGTRGYSDAYLQTLEDVIVRQTQLSLGLPPDEAS